MKPKIDPSSPVPLYHQIAESLRVAIELGELTPGEALEPMRQAAEAWGVHIHTVRHAYAALARDGLVETRRGPRGTRVLGPREAPSPVDADAAAFVSFLARIEREARELFELSPLGLADVLRRRATERAVGSAVGTLVHVVECSEWQCLCHAREIEAVFNVEARAWPLPSDGEPPDGPMISTYFHYNDIRRLWPERLETVRFITIYPDPALKTRLAGTSRLVVCERDLTTAETVAADLVALLSGTGCTVEPRVAVAEGAAALLRASDVPVLFAPRVWALLPDAVRQDPRALELRYVLDAAELAEMGGALGWQRREAAA